eukprot:2170286-Pyramimonas_sp.AAC.2
MRCRARKPPAAVGNGIAGAARIYLSILARRDTIAPNIRTIAPSIRTIAPNIHTLAPNIHTLAPNIHTILHEAYGPTAPCRVHSPATKCYSLLKGPNLTPRPKKPGYNSTSLFKLVGSLIC